MKALNPPQPFHPAVPEVRGTVWQIPREGIPDLAAALYAQVMWGCEPHASQVSKTYLSAWESVRPRWEAATTKLLEMLEEVGHLELTEA